MTDMTRRMYSRSDYKAALRRSPQPPQQEGKARKGQELKEIIGLLNHFL
jgi:hypothetical protein